MDERRGSANCSNAMSMLVVKLAGEDTAPPRYMSTMNSDIAPVDSNRAPLNANAGQEFSRKLSCTERTLLQMSRVKSFLKFNAASTASLVMSQPYLLCQFCGVCYIKTVGLVLICSTAH